MNGKQPRVTSVSAEVQEPIHNIRNATANLQLMVNNLKGADQDPETHPKIKSIAKNSLPLFFKAMNSSLCKGTPRRAGGVLHCGS